MRAFTICFGVFVVCLLGRCDAMLECGMKKGATKKCDPEKNEILCHKTASENKCSTLADCLKMCKGKDCCCTEKWDEDMTKCVENWEKEMKTESHITCYGQMSTCPMTQCHRAYCTIDYKKHQGCSNVAPKKTEKCCKCAFDHCNENMDTCRNFKHTCGSGDKTEKPYANYEVCDNDKRQITCMMTNTEGPKCATPEDCWKSCPKGAKNCCCNPAGAPMLKFSEDCEKMWQKSYDLDTFSIKCLTKDNKEVECRKGNGWNGTCALTPNDKKHGCFHNTALCNQEVGTSGCCCAYTDNCNKDMKTCTQHMPTTKKPLRSGAAGVGAMKWVVVGTVGLAVAGLA